MQHPDQRFKTPSISHKPLPVWLNLKHALISCRLKFELLKRDGHTWRGTWCTHIKPLSSTVIENKERNAEFKRLQGVCVHVNPVKCTGVCVCQVTKCAHMNSKRLDCPHCVDKSMVCIRLDVQYMLNHILTYFDWRVRFNDKINKYINKFRIKEVHHDITF